MKGFEAEKEKKRFFTKNIVRWGKRNLLEYPWRKVDDPFKILIGELLLRKTTAEQVEDIFPKFTQRYPTPKSIMNSNFEEIKGEIEELGMSNIRTEQIIDISKKIKDNFNNNVPNSFTELSELPGVGRYTANSILCFGFDEPKPIVDTNVIRVLTRYFNIKSDKSRPRTDDKMWEFAENLIPLEDSKLYNYSLLDFGKLVCKSANPDCTGCLLKNKCVFPTL